MNKPLLTVLALSALGLGACETMLAPGHYEDKSVSTNAQGTKTTVKKETDVYYDQHGNKKATVQTKTTRDPKGWFNKETTESVKTYN